MICIILLISVTCLCTLRERYTSVVSVRTQICYLNIMIYHHPTLIKHLYGSSTGNNYNKMLVMEGNDIIFQTRSTVQFILCHLDTPELKELAFKQKQEKCTILIG